MSSARKTLILIGLLMSTTVHACDIEGCSLPASLHKIDGDGTPTHGVWTLLHHDLAVARQSIKKGRAAYALELAHSLDKIVRRRLNDLITFSGTQSLVDYHRALQRVVEDAGGWPLAEIKVGGLEA